MAFIGTIALFAVKEYWHKKTSPAKRSYVNRWSSPFNQVVKGIVSLA
jgi:hypothetical protein